MIFSLEQVKKFIKDTSITDDQISDRIDPTFDDLRDLVHSDFVNPRRKITDTFEFVGGTTRTIKSKNAKLITDFGFKADDYIYISGTFNNDGHFQIETITEDTIVIQDRFELYDENRTSTVLMFKAELSEKVIKTVADLIEFDVKLERNLASESYARHSLSFNTDLPPETMKRIKTMRKLRW